MKKGGGVRLECILRLYILTTLPRSSSLLNPSLRVGESKGEPEEERGIPLEVLLEVVWTPETLYLKPLTTDPLQICWSTSNHEPEPFLSPYIRSTSRCRLVCLHIGVGEGYRTVLVVRRTGVVRFFTFLNTSIQVSYTP